MAKRFSEGKAAAWLGAYIAVVLLVAVAVGIAAGGRSGSRDGGIGLGIFYLSIFFFGDVQRKAHQSYADTFVRRLHYEARVRLTVNGEPFEGRATFKCVPHVPRDNNRIRVYRDVMEWMALRLPSGEGVVFRMPKRFCRRIAAEDSPYTREDFTPIAGYLPVVYWLDDAEKPRRIEAFITPEYYDRPDRRLGFEGIDVRRVGRSEPTDPSEAVPWLRIRKLGPKFSALYSYVLFESDWSEVEKLAKRLKRSHNFSILNDDDRLLVSRLLLAAPLNFYPERPVREKGEAPRLGDGRNLQRLRSAIRPIRVNGHRLELDLNETGVLLFFPNVNDISDKTILYVGKRKASLPASFDFHAYWAPWENILFFVRRAKRPAYFRSVRN